MRINLGSGIDKLDGYVNVDIADIEEVDVAHNLDVEPWPFEDNSAEEIRAFDIFEHIEDPLLFMRECHRILEPDGRLVIHTTHWQTMNSFTDPTHKRFCTEQTFDYWIEGTDYQKRYGKAYGGNRVFAKRTIYRDGQELAVILSKIA